MTLDWQCDIGGQTFRGPAEFASPSRQGVSFGTKTQVQHPTIRHECTRGERHRWMSHLVNKLLCAPSMGFLSF